MNNYNVTIVTVPHNVKMYTIESTNTKRLLRQHLWNLVQELELSEGEVKTIHVDLVDESESE